MRLYKVTTPDGAVIFSELDEIACCFNGELCASDIGDKFEIEVVEMTEREYEALPDFEP